MDTLHGSAASDDEATFTTVSSAPPKRRSGRTKFQETRHPVYKGVRRRNTDRWVCEVREPKKKSRIWLGTFPTAEMAARAHDVAAIAFHGRSACLNFADSAWRVPVPESSSPCDIQQAAAKVVEVFGSDVASGSNAVENAAASWTISDAGWFVDDELDVGMQGYLEMAQGMLIDPPPMLLSDTEVDCYDGEIPLWSFST